MRDEQILRLEEMDSRHWWTRSRLGLIKSHVRKLNLGMSRIFEIGAGSGGTLSDLKKEGYSVIALEPTLYGANNCAKNGIETINLSIEDLKVIPSNTGCLLLLDVLEHLADDKKILQKLCNASDDNTFLIVTVPADMKLWSQLDLDVYHHKRYEKNEIYRILSETGWTVQSQRYWMSILKPVAKFRRKRMNADFYSETKLPNLLLNFTLFALVSIEKMIPIMGRIPGTSILTVAKKLNV